jgi:uncharacterized OB-fold protein
MATAAELPSPEIPVNIETAPFWEATAEGRLVLSRCLRCHATIWYPRAVCPECGSLDTEWYEASGRGTVYSFTVNRQRSYFAEPYVVAYVELDEGPRIMTNIVDVDPEDVAIGQPVRVVFGRAGDGPVLPRFAPA